MLEQRVASNRSETLEKGAESAYKVAHVNRGGLTKGRDSENQDQGDK